ncbi:hypothetical protein PCYB_122900 [Plasmodium cynomolgi strain B]|uniref:Uncharacterized protein n=1 Tax=Plasmodium cynomolgi (strain B) TaxID=1120755 RepID=K6ULH5_PLACD|nr:hypothetical protein PCYB_122900 [Plasmodium cynomolgi strain B]GAB67723.1 hypothetical protein PCYB_122900 [Plasmodium cynomolgi strain B]
MPVALNCLSEEGRRALEQEGGPEPVLHKASDIEFVYNKLNLGEGKLYIMEKKIRKKKKLTKFTEIANSASYLKHYEKNRNFYMHLLNDVNNVIVDSSNIALHAITSDKKICDTSCVYIQLNSDITGGGGEEEEEDMDCMGDEDVAVAVADEGTNHVGNGVDDAGDGTDEVRCRVDHTEGDEASRRPREKLGKRLFAKMVKQRSVFKKNEENDLGGEENGNDENCDDENCDDENCDDENGDVENCDDDLIEEKITPEILLVSKNYLTNDAIFRQMSNMDHSPDDEDDASEGEETAEEEEEA